LPECPEVRRYLEETQRCIKMTMHWMEEIVVMMSTKARVGERDSAERTATRLKPCRMADKGCASNHLLDKCEVFGRLSAESRLAKLQEWRLCLYCFRHRAKEECYSRSGEEYQGCGVKECRDHHHRSLHYALIVARVLTGHGQPAATQQRQPKKPRARRRRRPQSRAPAAAVAARETVPVPETALKMEVGIPEATPAATGASPLPVATPEETAGKEEAGGQGVDKNRPPAAGPRKRRPAFGFWTAMAMLAVAGM